MSTDSARASEGDTAADAGIVAECRSATGPVAPTAELVTRFRFEHKVFQSDGAYFTLDKVSGRPCLSMPLGGVIVSLSLEKLCREFGIERSTPDYDLLNVLERALRYVERVYPGDTIPSEVIDGTASWAFKPEHQNLARGRVLHAVMSRGAGDRKPKDRAAWLAFEKTHRGSSEATAAVESLAREIKQEPNAIIETMDKITREFAYIEALREFFRDLFSLPGRVDVWRRRAADDRVRREEYDRIIALIEAPIEEARSRFTKLDRRFDAPEMFFGDQENAVVIIRQQRDLLHVETMKWRDILALWRDPTEKEEELRRRETYRFLATHFARGAEWAANAQMGAPNWGFGRR